MSHNINKNYILLKFMNLGIKIIRSSLFKFNINKFIK